jgi:hypothetical protein
MANGLASGNVINGVGAGSYYDQYVQPIPGYRFYSVAGYAALKASADNRFPVWIPSQEKGQPRKRMQIPIGAQLYSVGARLGAGVWGEAAQKLQLTAVVAGAPVLAQSVRLDALNTSAGQPVGKKHVLFQATSENSDKTASSTLFRSGRSSVPFDPAIYDAFNAPIASGSDEIERVGGSIELEVQARTTAAGDNAPLITAGAGVGGLRQNADFPNEAYILVQVGYWMVSPDIVTADDFAGVVWDEVFANV